MKKTSVAIGLGLSMILGVVAPAAAVDPVPLSANLYELEFEGYSGASANGVGYLAAPTSGSGPTLSVEISGLTPNTDYKVRIAGPEDGNTTPTTCSGNPASLAPFTADTSEFLVGGNTIQFRRRGRPALDL